MKTYLGFEDIPVYNFYKIVETSDMRWFYRDFRTERNIKVSDDDLKKLIDRYKLVYDDRVKYTNDVKSLEYYRKLNEISDLETKLYRITSAFDVLIDIKVDSNLFSEYVTYFKEDEGFSYSQEIKDDKTAVLYVDWLRNRIKGFETRVAVKKSNYSDVLKPVDINSKNANFDIIKEKILLQESLLVTIDVYTCPLIEWCAMVLRAEQKSVNAKKELDRIKNKR